MKYLCLLVILGVLIGSTPSFAGTYYVSNGGTAPWSGGGNCTNSATPCAYTTANTNAAAGDTVIYLNDGGDYTVSSTFINPSNSGTAGNYITFQAEAGATVNVYHSGNAASVVNRSYIVIDGFHFYRTGAGMWVNCSNSSNTSYVSNYITIQNNYFRTQSGNVGNTNAGLLFSGHYNRISILNNYLGGHAGSGTREPDDLIAFYGTFQTGQTNHYLLVQGNTMYGGNHMCSALSSGNYFRYLIFRNNNISNPNHTGFSVYARGIAQDVLAENNIVYDCGSACVGSVTECPENTYGSTADRVADRWAHWGFQGSFDNGIVRRNVFYNNGSAFYSDYGSVTNDTFNTVRLYHNVFTKNVVGTGATSSAVSNAGIDDYIWKNNALLDNDLPGNLGTTYHARVDLYDSPCTMWYINNNFDGTGTLRWNGNCLGLNGNMSLADLQSQFPTYWYGNTAEASGFTNAATKDFTLAVGSALIDAGAWLTTAVGAGVNSTSLVVADARYFTDGYSMITGDTIQIEGAAAVTISSINYSTNTITLSAQRSWSNGAGIAHNSYGGTAPDIGAYESTEGTGDVTIPVISDASPSVTQACTSNPRDVILSVTCTDNIACVMCKADTTETDMDSMTLTMTQSAQTWSYTLEDLSCNSTDDYQVECEDAAGNESGPTTITVTIQAEEYTPPASFVRGITAGTGTIAGGGAGKILGD